MPLLRIDYRGWYDNKRRQAFKHFNMLAGSVMFLDPGTQYELNLEASDPDGGRASKSLIITTRSRPRLGKPLRTFHVFPPGKANAGDARPRGSKPRPLYGLDSTAGIARPGDLFLLHAGEYKGTVIKQSGTPGRYVAWRAAGDGAPIIKSHIAIEGSYLWFEGLVFEPADPEDYGGIRGRPHGLRGIVIVKNTFRNCRYAVSNTPQTWNGDRELRDRYWYISDNVAPGGEWTEYFTRVYLLADSDICYNRISTTLNGKGGDGIAVRYCINLDLYHDDLRDVDDDLFEPDAAYGNIRIWRNRGINPRYQAISMQPMMCSPWYVVQNEFLLMHPGRRATIFKTNVFDRTVQVNKTFVVRGRYAQGRADLLLKSFSRNNLWIHIYDNPYEKTNPGGALWWSSGDSRKDERYQMHGQTRADWRSDADYDGFDWGDLPTPFWWAGKRLRGLKDLFAIAGIEAHGIRIRKQDTFTVNNLAAYAAEPYSRRRLILKASSKAIDAGQPVPNLADDYAGKAPDLGAYEWGRPLRHYGPRW